MTTVAVTTWNGRVSPVLDVARQVELLDVEDGRVVGRRQAGLPGADPFQQAAALLALRARVLICGAVSRPLADQLIAGGIELAPFTAGETEAVIRAWLDGTLANPALRMPGCGGRRQGWCGGGRGRHGRGCRAGGPRRALPGRARGS